MRSCGPTLAGLAASALIVGAAGAREPPCAETRRVADVLHGSYGELPISAGLQENGQLLQIFASPDTGSWTAVTTSPRGISCVLATGRRWADRAATRGTPADRPPLALVR